MRFARGRVKLGMGWRWWVSYRRWSRLCAVTVHSLSLRPQAPTVRLTPARLGLAFLLVTTLTHGEPSRVVETLMLGWLGVVLMNQGLRWRYRSLLRELLAMGNAWPQARLDAYVTMRMAAWRFHAYRW